MLQFILSALEAEVVSRAAQTHSLVALPGSFLVTGAVLPYRVVVQMGAHCVPEEFGIALRLS